MPDNPSTAGKEECLKNVSFDEQVAQMTFIKPLWMNFERRGMKLRWELAFDGDSASAIVYNVDRRQLLCVKQFRPAVFTRKIMRLPENKGKKLSEINFETYPVSVGMTLELCAGLMDKPNLSSKQIIIEEIYEELGFRAKPENVEYVQTLTMVGCSGAEQHLFFATVNDSDQVNDGGGNLHEGEIVERVYLDLDQLEQASKTETVPAIFSFGINWFIRNKLDAYR